MTRKNMSHIKALKQTLDHGLIQQKVHTIIELNQQACLKPYMNTELRTWAKNDFDFFKSMNNSVRKNCGKCKEAQRHQTCENCQAKKLSDLRT